MNRIARCDWLPERASWKPGRDYPLYPARKISPKPYNKSFIDQVCSVKMAGYWPRSFFASLRTSTSSRSISTYKKNLANIQPSWPHTWSITHTYSLMITNSGALDTSVLTHLQLTGAHCNWAWDRGIPSNPKSYLSFCHNGSLHALRVIMSNKGKIVKRQSNKR